METPKLSQHMRMAALQCNFEGGKEKTLKIPTLWKEFGFDTEQLFHPIGELYSAVFDKEEHADILKRYCAESANAGINIILYLNCHILLKSQNHMANEWARQNIDGSYTKLYETYFANCLNSTWMDYFFSLIKDLAEYPIAGVFFDGPINTQCYCPRCSAKFAKEYKKPITKANEGKTRLFPSTAPLCRTIFLRANFLDMKRGRLPARIQRRKDFLRLRTAGPFYWTKSARLR